MPSFAQSVPGHALSAHSSTKVIATQMNPRGVSRDDAQGPTSENFIQPGEYGSWLPDPTFVRNVDVPRGREHRGTPEILWFACADLHASSEFTSAQPGEHAELLQKVFVVVWSVTIFPELRGRQLLWRLSAFPTYAHGDHDDSGGDANERTRAKGASFDVASGHLKSAPNRSESKTSESPDGGGPEETQGQVLRCAVAFKWGAGFLRNFRIQLDFGVAVS